MTIQALLERWSYLAIACGAFVEGEAVLLSSGALANARLLSLPFVVLAGSLGSVAWGQTWFQIGHVSGRSLLARRPSWRGRAFQVERWLSRFGPWVLVVGRFAPGLGTVLPATIGASGFSRRRFVLWDSLGALVWATVFSGVGFGLGAAVHRVSDQPLGWVEYVSIGLGAAASFGLMAAAVGSVRRRRRRARARGAADGTSPFAAKRVIITADDFGLAVPVNEAVEQAHREGVLTTTSLLIGEADAADAVERALRNPGLRVGLHVAVCEGRPCLPASEVPALVNSRGELRHPIAALLLFFLLAPSRAFRRQLRAEIRAQFAAFAATGLDIDHVNGHNNMQLHPVVLPILLELSREYGVSAVRVPYEPLLASWRAARSAFLARACVWVVMAPWAGYVRRRLRREGFVVNDYLFGIFDCGAVDCELLRGMLANLPPGLSEIHCHPATRRCAAHDRHTPTYLHQAELAALVHPQTRLALAASGAESVAGFSGARLALSAAEPRPT